MSIDITDEPDIIYPESDGKPMADNTEQWDWMVKIVGELRTLYDGQDVFIAGDLFWYPVKGEPKIVTAPDSMVIFGRPSGYRGSYKQWIEGGIPPQVVFEILSPGNTEDELDDKRLFYETYGVIEYYVIEPFSRTYEAYRRRGTVLEAVPQDDLDGFVSPLLNVTFDLQDGLRLLRPDGREFQFREDRERELLAELRRVTEENESLTATIVEKEAVIVEKEAVIVEKEAVIAQKDAALKMKEAELEVERLEKAKLKQRDAEVEAYLRQLGIDPASIPRAN